MRNILIIGFLFFSFLAFSAENEATATEAQAGCMTPQCLGTDGALGSPDVEIAELCRYTLPEHCQKIKNIKLTTCYDDQTEWGGSTGASVLACGLGLWEGVVDVGVGTWNILKGAFKFTVDSEYREEALNTMSYLSEQFSDSEKAKAFLTDPLLEDVDEWAQCLNYKGRWEYVCEAGIQVVGTLFVLDKGEQIVRFPFRKVKELMGGRVTPRLTMRQKYQQRKKLQELLKSSAVNMDKLSVYQLQRLRPKDMRKVDASTLKSDISDLLSRRHLRAISLPNIRQMPVAGNARTLSRLSDDQFRAVMGSGNDISQMPFEAIEGNIKRIRGADIGKLDNLDQISPKAFGLMSANQIRGMSYKQVNNVTPDQEARLNDRLREALTQTRQKRKKEEDERVAAAKEKEKQQPATAEPPPKPAESPPKPAATESSPKPAAAESPPKPAAAESPSKPATAEPPSKPAAAESPPKPAAAESPSKPAAAESPPKPAAAESPSKPAVAEPPSKPAKTTANDDLSAQEVIKAAAEAAGVVGTGGVAGGAATVIKKKCNKCPDDTDICSA